MYINQQLEKKAKYLVFIFIARSFNRRLKILPLIEKNKLYNNKLAKEIRNNYLKEKVFKLIKDYYNEINNRKINNNK